MRTSFEQELTAPAADLLVVDDEITSLHLLTEILTREGYRVRSAESAPLAIESALAHSPDLILLDVKMPDMSAFDACRWFREDERTRDIPIIFVSGREGVRDRIRGFEVGGVDFISKPFQEVEVLARVQTHLRLRDMQLNLEGLVSERTAALMDANDALRAEIAERDQAERTLRESEERYRTLVEQAQDGIIVIQDGKIRFANSYAAGLTGLAVEDLPNTRFEAYLPAEQLPKVVDMYRRRMNNEAVPSVYQSAVQHKDGSQVEVEFNVSSTTYDRKPAEVVVIRDITKRVQAQQELQESQRLINLVIDNVPALVSYIDKDQHYRFANQRYEQVYGVPRSHIVGKHVREVLGSQGYAAAEPHITAVLAGDRVSYEDVFRYPDIGPRWMRIDYVPDRDQAGDVHGAVAMIRDITEHKQAEEAIETSEAHLRRAQEVANAGSWELDLTNGKLFWSEEIYRMFGLPRDTPVDYDTFLGFVLPEDREYVGMSWQAALDGETYDIEHRVRAGGRIKWVRERAEVERDETGRAIRGIGIVQDITDRKQAERALRESEERFRATFEQAAVGIAHVSPDGWFLRINRRFCDIVGYSHEEMLEMTFQNITHADDLDIDLAHARQLLSGEIETYSTEKRYFHKNGEIVWVALTVSLVREHTGEPRWFVAVVEDITTRKQIEQQIQEYQQRLKSLVYELTLAEERERRRIAVELHDHVGQSLAFALVRLASARKASSDDRQITILNDISESLRQAIWDTEHLVFDLSSPLLNELGLSAAISEWLEEQIEKKCGLQTEFVDDGREKRLEEDVRAILFRNVRELLTNTVKHAHANKVSVRVDRAGDNVQVIIQDDGNGFDLQAALGVTSREGGFGLFSIQERMVDLGGSLEIVSEPGQGCKAILISPMRIR